MGILKTFGALFGGQAIPGQYQREHALVEQAQAKLVDVRSPGEFAMGHAAKAVNIPVQELGARIKEIGDKSHAVIVYCRSGNRSAQAASMLKQQGFMDVTDARTQQIWESGR